MRETGGVGNKMGRKSKADKLAELHDASMREFDAVVTEQYPDRVQCLEDRRFADIPGAQWEGGLGEQFENKPKFEKNKVHLACLRIVNEYRNNRVSVDFISKDGESDELADTCDGLLRADEVRSNAVEAYDTAFDGAVKGGMGAWRLRVCEDEDDEEENLIEFEPIQDAETRVFFNRGAQKQDKRDARWCWVLTPYTRDAAKDEFGIELSSMPKDVSTGDFDWVTPDRVWISETYHRERQNETVHIYRNPLGEEIEVTDEDLEPDEDEEEITYAQELEATGYVHVRDEKRKRWRVRKLIEHKGGVVEDCGYIAGPNIPVVVTYGKRVVIDGIERCAGHVRMAKDAQRLENMLISWLALMSAQPSQEKPIFHPQQIAGHETLWKDDPVQNYPFLMVNPMTDPVSGQMMPAGPIGFTKVAQIPPAMAALVQLAGQDLQELLGSQQAGEQLQPNQSGKAVELIQQRLDMQVFIYMDNFAKAMRRSGEIWLGMRRELDSEDDKKVKTVGVDGSASAAVLNQQVMKDGVAVVKNNIREAAFDVVADVGPSTSSKRSGLVRALTGMMMLTQDPADLKIMTAAVMMNIEGEGLADINKHYRMTLVRMGVIPANDEEKAILEQEKAAQPADPQAEYLKASAQEAMTNAQKNQAETQRALADAELKGAQTVKTLADAGSIERGDARSDAQAVHSMSKPDPGQGDRAADAREVKA